MAIEPSLISSLTWFAHVARHRSFTKAASEMGVTRAALSQHVKGLEKQLQVRLLNRTTRNMSLTEEGQRLLDTLHPSLTNIEQALNSLNDLHIEPAGLIRISASRTAARLLIEPHLGEFLSRYPKIRLELIMDDGLTNIVAEGMDAGIRLGVSLDEHMVAIPITPNLTNAIVGSPDYFKRYGKPETPNDLEYHNCLAYRFTSSGTLDHWSLTSPDVDKHTVIFEPKGNAVFNDDYSMLQAAIQGVGLIKHIDLWVLKYLEEGKLERVFVDWCKPFPGFYLYIPSRENMPKKIRVLMDFLIEKRAEL
ncbi:LysR family transcriptional regulator [Vibrio parahaemolyticus]|uniref:LysR family transcriptional regulator n=1 Tax=Vibrio parahaemolyticus TaxID=670 RepID=A0A6H0JIW3_VIBPH|nr:LysR family transcriptional regulator [Vibrio parahaemolyticus]AMG07333.1 LysR family transcriptional regulator [Vibrio parahaemolyticus]ANB96894.1 HTH-type transcriptional regulator DmlR [Vibrio parahaemolyticus]EGR0427446.1 LysR family transcriptional regulator [Vibrio parahaemolyticus]EHR5479102.1 LysR family transcriptional regulator [Vibrio parahaemolyticus]EIU6866930.1 LysR family transcriptional regulator [Vibrio parahaemolyticus]